MLLRVLDKYRSMPLPAKAGVWFTLCSIIQRGISVISMPIFTRLLTTDAYGTYSLYTSWCMLFSLVVTLNLASEVFNKGLTDHANERPDYTTSQAALITVLVGGFFAVYLLLREKINALTGMGTLLTCLMFLDIYTSVILSLWFARKRFDYAYKQLIAATLFISVASVLLGIACVWAAPDDWKVVARVASNIAPSAVLAIAVWALFLRDSREFFEREWWGQSIRLGIPLIPHYASQVLLNQADKVMISWFLDNTRVAIYGVAHSAGLLLIMVNNGINSSFVPWLYGNLRKGDCAKVPGVTNVLLLLVTLLVFLLMLFAPECVALLATADYQEAIWCIPPIATGVVFSFLYTLFVNVEIYYGRAGYVATASILSAVLNTALNFIAIPLFGYIASAYVTAACYLATAALHFVFVKRTLRDAKVEAKVFDDGFLGFCCVLTIACAAVSLFLYNLGWVRYLFIGVYAVGLFVFRDRFLGVLRGMRGTA